ncbi:molybdate ABC transporter substrate-binding protein [Sphingomonas jatrophae]|uniref:Molybdate transport system substrate-binding protein n=1 Tax=Sphingomonas jatrophae TaxID=1166337 RepID=A0A1I6JM00_9SPHN|nr:molybdate ABC transporter substrate-binding protein [Sphingomonas jatrophae]SFR79993.1 molybdate transport system substrate-binding protein [Sphingomonas jatrophae]
MLAAISLREGMTQAAAAWVRQGHEPPRLVFAGTPALARQIAAGAPADLFVSADEAWADRLQGQRRLRPGTRATFLANRLAVAVPRGRAPLRRMDDLSWLVGTGRLALAAPESVPAGRYAKAALERAGLWRGLASRVVRADDVRGALALVARGAAAAAIVYATDIAVEPRVRSAGLVPARLTPPVRYVIAIPTAARDPDAAAFRAFLLSPAGRAPFLRAGFLPPR